MLYVCSPLRAVLLFCVRIAPWYLDVWLVYLFARVYWDCDWKVSFLSYLNFLYLEFEPSFTLSFKVQFERWFLGRLDNNSMQLVLLDLYMYICIYCVLFIASLFHLHILFLYEYIHLFMYFLVSFLYYIFAHSILYLFWTTTGVVLIM